MRVKSSPLIASRLFVYLATLAVLSAGIGCGSDRAGATPALETAEKTSATTESRIENLIHDWFAVLEDPTADASHLNRLLAGATFELSLDGRSLRNTGALLAWVSRLRATYPQIEYRIDSIRIDADGPDRYRVRFEFDRHALDAAGHPHVARREHTWIVQDNPDLSPVILEIEERPLLFFPGSGPRVVCY